jgi:hypothetical protein
MLPTKSKSIIIVACCVLFFELVSTRNVSAQGYDPRDFYAANSDGTGINKWVKHRGYRTIYEFFISNPGEGYHKRLIYFVEGDSAEQKFVLDPDDVTVIGRWDSRGYSNLPGNKQGKRLSKVKNSDFPPPEDNPIIPYSRDNYPRSEPPPIMH